MRSPPWHRDELILAMDLYLQLEPGQIHARNPRVIALSELLNKLPIHSGKGNFKDFRNPNGVGLKLSNFLAIDDTYPGKGMQRGAKLDKEVFDEYVGRPDDLKRIASKIKGLLENEEVILKMPDVEYEDYSAKEGKLLFKYHRYRERDPKLVKRKKDRVFNTRGKLECEVCEFDFAAKYGDLGKGFIECHHRVPLSEIDQEREIRLEDLALVCANCHRMLHRDTALSTNELKSLMVNY
ncbi:HNH endonuclease [Croceimicrobium sp.]|uniref:HNH endonuclease n=1 Tax=Croceimicrobium sp. TaxID=2828340 RepID=UPI003BAB3F09